MELSSSSAPVSGSGRTSQTAGPHAVPAAPRPSGRRASWAVWAAAGLALLAGVGFYLKAKTGPAGAGKSGPIGVPTAVAASGSVQEVVRVTGTVSAQRFASLLAPRIQGSRSGMNRGGTDATFGGVASATSSGGGPAGGALPMGDFSLVLMKLARPGSGVKEGDVVAEFDPQMQLQRLDDYRDSVVQLENNIQKMKTNLAAVKDAHDQTVRSAKSDWDKAVLDLKTAPVRSGIDVEKYKLALEQAEATYKELVEESPLVEEQQRAQIRVSELNHDQSLIELKRAEANVQKMTVKAPMAGMVVMASIVRNGEFGQIREGDQVNPGQPFLSIVDPSSMVLKAAINQVDAEKLRLGMKTLVHLDAYPEIELPGTLIGISAMSKTSTFRAGYVGEIPILIRIERTDPRVIPDLTGNADIVVGGEQAAVAVPRAAVFEEHGGSFVYVRTPEAWVKKQVTLGIESFTTAAIQSGLQKGDVVALRRPT
jgi:HlyD family secretion protein